jgi:Ca-activated chloride channel family protein
MIRSLTSGTVAFAVACLAAVGAQQTPVFRGVGDAVRVFVTVTDGDGRLVTTLQREAFEVRDEGKPQPITLFDNTPQPIRLIVMLDVSGSMEGNLPLLRAASDQLFGRLRPDDVVRVGTFGRDVEISPTFTHDVDLLRAALPKFIAPDAPTPLWRALDEALDGFQKDEGDARPVILVLSDGKDSGMFEPSFTKQPVSQAEIIDRARSESVMIYAVGMRSRSRQRMPPTGGLPAMLTADLPDPGLARVAQETGGGYIEIRLGEDLGPAFARVADELHSQYLLGFAPPQRDGKRHDVEVRLTQRGLTARARKSYVAPKG